MMRHLARILTAVFLLVLCNSQVPGQETSRWVGQRVITKLRTVLKVGNQIVVIKQFNVYHVERVNGPWLWLVDERLGVSGWVKVEQVILYD